MAKNYPLSLEEFKVIYSKVPRLTVEVVLSSDKGALLTKRDIEPYKGSWHLPGGTVYFGERLTDAVARVAKKELGVDAKKSQFLEYIEYPNHYENGLDCPVGMAFLVDYEGDVQVNEEASAAEWFSELPDDTHPDQVNFINKIIRA